jgi:hypothetical protein
MFHLPPDGGSSKGKPGAPALRQDSDVSFEPRIHRQRKAGADAAVVVARERRETLARTIGVDDLRGSCLYPLPMLQHELRSCRLERARDERDARAQCLRGEPLSGIRPLAKDPLAQPAQAVCRDEQERRPCEPRPEMSFQTRNPRRRAPQHIAQVTNPTAVS